MVIYEISDFKVTTIACFSHGGHPHLIEYVSFTCGVVMYFLQASLINNSEMSRITRKSTFRVSNQVKIKPTDSTLETN